MAKEKKRSVTIDGQKYKDGDKVVVVITGRIRVSEPLYWDQKTTEVYVEYGPDLHEFYLTDAVEGVTSAKDDGVTVVKS